MSKEYKTKNYKIKYTPEQCYFCNKFLSHNEQQYIWTEHGSYDDIEPPDQVYAHKYCFENNDYNRLIYENAWIKPFLINIKL